ncbi:MAG: adenylyltransferase/cytidyltransferase family protein [Patescibacteria group bacterium]
MKKVLVFGVFDGLHEGHRAFLRQARTDADFTRNDAEEKIWLIAAVTRDEVVRQLKGRPSQKDQGLRIKELMEIGLVDEVVEGDAELRSWEVIGKYAPDVIALGYDQGALKSALEEYIREKGLEIEVRVMKPYKSDKYHSSLLNK